MESFTNEGADRHAGAPGPALPPDAAHEGGAAAGNVPGAASAAATHEGGAADDPAGAAPPAEAADVALPGTPAAAAPLLAAQEIPAAAPAVEESQPRTRRPRPDDGQRVGTWRTEERQYVTEVILRFGEGRLPNVPDNTSLRVLLSTVLNCSPMRITKKFSGRNALPRGRYRRTAAPEPAALERLRTLERAFHRRVRDDGAKLTTSLCGTYDLPTPQSLVDATTTAQASAGRRSPTAKRSRSRSRTASPDPPPTLMAPVPSSYGAPALAGPYTGPEPAYAGAWPAPPAPPEPHSLSIAVAGLLDLAPVPDAPAASRPVSAAPAPAPGPGTGAPFSL
mmetsp:Transcript_23209/g.69387  ORF Transcript_23209/g.69387 Transcript_23209/m.69387 type:complete len:336 (+) Transcript_23209:131-1138(+)